MRRTPEGVVEVWGEDDVALAAATGFAHGMDRMLQMLLVRLIGQGRVSECLRSDEESLTVDRFAREMGFAADAEEDVSNVTGEALRFAKAYCRGVDHALEHQGTPWELRLVRYRPEPWRVADILLALKMMAYLSLAQSQQDTEKFIIEAFRAGVDPERLKALFAPHLDGMTPELVELVRKTPVHQPLFSPAVRFRAGLPRIMASNNWVVSGARTASGHPLHCNDPHLEANRLPAIWYEQVQHTADDFRIGVSMPGTPGLIFGRTRDTSFGFTYGFMDTIDYFVEEVRGGRCRRGADFEELTVREECIRRKGRAPVTFRVWESRHGVLEVPPGARDLEDGNYLCRAWSGHRHGAARGLSATYEVLRAKTVQELQDVLAEVTISCNWLVADSAGNIGYQQSGRLPLRRHSGLHPVPGWDERYDWQGTLRADRLARITNPPEGYLATANDDLNVPSEPLSINLPMGAYRAERIRALIAEREDWTVEGMKEIQRDLTSLQAERFMELFRPHLPDTPVGRLLGDWDLRYDRDSRGATLFEEIYRGLLAEVFGKGLFGEEAWAHAAAETGLLVDFYHVFDEALLGGDPAWFGGGGREGLLAQLVPSVLGRHAAPGSVPTWGSQRQVEMTHLFFQGRLPRWLGFDRGPIVLEGNRATIVQGSIYRSHGRTTTFCPSYRFVADLSQHTAHTSLAGGPSDRRFSRYYLSDLARWQRYEYKLLDGDALPTR